MLEISHRQRLERRCTVALTKAIDSFPQLLAQSESEAAAAIVADLIKFQLSIKDEEPYPGYALAQVIKGIHERDRGDHPEG